MFIDDLDARLLFAPGLIVMLILWLWWLEIDFKENHRKEECDDRVEFIN